MKKLLIALVLFQISCFSVTAQRLSIQQTFHINSGGGWDYLSVSGNKLYVSHGTQVNILDKTTGDSLGVIPQTTGIHGIAFDEANNKGYTSNGRLNNVFVFDLQTNKVLNQIATGENPDAIMFDASRHEIITCNGRSKDLTVIDAKTEKVVATIPVGGKPETAVSDEKGTWYVNSEDKNEIVVINAETRKVEHHWSLAPGEAPTGLAFDKATERLFATCGDNKLLVIVDAITGKIIEKLPIGAGCDGAVFDAQTKQIFTSNGEGTITVNQEISKNKFKVVETVPTKKGARTIALDEATHKIYLPTADFEPLPANSPANTRPKMKAGTFQILVLGKK